ncbi:diacylglycerol diphosphate phosphatase / phosphatidate phosphatase [Entomortierella parvispora]|uniref:Diacylglycerol diphosphate phosphatase / phosphatidate phosphatase n=1 Tax=Entomortierella parvispora TaxID=205924 RepID=A0A9P3LZ59_9FUNG|nr:diacylglycerol diphosphate phosphatase / phosphatidate phosphatase [Entomortierella parvispora]
MQALRNPTTRLYASYAFDWIFCVIILILFFLLDRAEPFHRQFSVENTAIMFPMKAKDTIPVWALVLIAVVFPVLMIAVVAVGVRRSIYDFHNGILGLLLSILLTTIFTQVMKVTVGKDRPDFLDRCQPMQNGAPILHDVPLQLWSVDVCSQTNKAILKDGMRSFPSGHASTAFAGLFFLSLWMGGKMHVFDRRGYSLKSVILIVPILAALLVAISRIEDYRHSAIDVTWGSIIGIFFAIFAYLQYYPSLFSKASHIPHPPRDFSYLTRNSDGRSNEPGCLENATGIRPNHEFVDETRPYLHDQAQEQPLQQ